MAGLANGRGIVELVTIDADTHGCHAGCLGHRTHLGDLTMACLALYARFNVFAVRPGHARSHCVDSHPRNDLIRFGE